MKNFSHAITKMFSGPTQAINDARRAEYMANLKLTIDLDARVTAAVALNKRTGQTTPVTDFRSLDQKLADVEMLKVQVRADLLTITDAPNMTQIMTRLTNDDLRFVAQKFSSIAAEIKPKFKLGCTADQFMSFLRDYAARPLVAGAPATGNDIHQASVIAPSRLQVDALGHLIANIGAPR